MQNLKEIFPPIASYTYLNTPATGLIANPVQEYRQNQYKDLWLRGSKMIDSNASVFSEVREQIALSFGGQPGYVALLPAFSYGLNATLEGLAPGQKVLLLDQDYPSINQAVEERDFKVDKVKIDEHLEDRIYDRFQKDRPDVFIFSIVQYLNGIKLDLDFLKDLKKDFPETMLIGDGTQFLGMEKFDFQESGLDVLGASGYKWIGAGFGNGFFMFKPAMEDKIHPKYLGYGSVMGKYKESGHTLIGKYEGNHLDVSNVGSLKVALEFHKKVGERHIEQQVGKLAKMAKERLTDLGLLEDAVVKRKQHSAIFNLKGGDALFQKLESRQILATPRGNGIRIGFHFYNTEEDLKKLLEVLES